MNDSFAEQVIALRIKKFFNFLKNKSDWLSYAFLAVIVYIAVWIRTRNLAGLRDITTGGWTLGPDLDPFLFLRWAKYIVENGSLFAIDTMRYVPVGFETKAELIFLPYLMAGFHKIAVLFGSNSVEQSSSLFPVFMFGLTIVSFFLMVREIFIKDLSEKKTNFIALVSSFFISVFPALLPRTIAGIPEKESAAFFFMFSAFYFFLKSWKSEEKRGRYLFALLAGIFTAGMSLVWGGFVYIFYVIGIALLISYFLHSFDTRKALLTITWLVSSFAIMIPYSTRYSLTGLLKSTMTLPIIFTLVCLLVEKKFLTRIESDTYTIKGYKIPKKGVAFALVLFVGALLLTVLDLNFIVKTWSSVKQILVEPIVDRFGVTVAENRQPYFNEWTSSFGPSIGSFALGFWLSLIGITLIFYRFIAIGSNKRKLIISSLFFLTFLGIGISRYSPSGLLNGTSFVSILLYFGTIFAFVAYSFKFYRRHSKEELEKIRFGFIFLMSAFAFAFVAARSSVRTTMVLVPFASIMIGYLSEVSLSKLKIAFQNKKLSTVTILGVIILLAILFSAYNLYQTSNAIAKNYVPSIYNQQWQKAMSWTRENTPEDAVFAHWWDYGYWVQTLGERATALDGGNAIVYWDYFMGRYGLTGSDQKDTLEFFYAHNISHLLIDSTDIGKYSAFSSIGSNEDYDRRSWIPTFLRDNSQTSERKNSTVFVYPAGSVLDKDIRYNLDGVDLFFPEGKSYVAAIVLSVDNQDKVSEVFGVYFLQDKTYQIPIRYYFDKKEGFVDTGKGIEAGVFIYPRVVMNEQGGGNIEERGALLYLSQKTVKSNVARFYLYDEETESIKKTHVEPDFLASFINSQDSTVGDFIYYNEFKGPIKIWEITYPANIQFKEEYVSLEYPEFLARV